MLYQRTNSTTCGFVTRLHSLVQPGCGYGANGRNTSGSSETSSAREHDAAFWRRKPDFGVDLSLSGTVDGRRSGKLSRLEAVLFVLPEAMPPRRLATLAGLSDATEVRTVVQQLNATYDRCGTAFRVERVAAGYRLFTRPEVALWLGKLHPRESELKLSPPALETLTVIAYRQPLTRSDVEAIRGVQCGEMIKQLMDRGLVRLAGTDDSLGRPFLYETTRRFLEVFGLQDLTDLPKGAQLRRPMTGPEAAAQNKTAS